MTDTISPTLKAKTLLWIVVRDVVLIKSMREDEASDFIMYNKSARALLDYIAELEAENAHLMHASEEVMAENVRLRAELETAQALAGKPVEQVQTWAGTTLPGESKTTTIQSNIRLQGADTRQTLGPGAKGGE